LNKKHSWANNYLVLGESMKYITILSLIIMVLIMLLGSTFETSVSFYDASSFLRIHIRANSNETNDQLIKYSVKNEVVKVLTPILANCTTKELAYEAISKNFSLIEEASNKILVKNGLNYRSKAKLINEYFPTRSYNSVILTSGRYDALVLELGEALGNNWWCVVYPPLCFVNFEATNSNRIVYKSKLLEIIRNFFKI
jgi:stage II sporulation protein R